MSNGKARNDEPTAGWRQFGAGVARTLSFAAAFAVVGLSLAYAARSMAEHPDHRAERAVEPAPRIWLVDGFNVLHAALLGGRDRSRWWTEEKREQVLELARHFDDRAAELWIVFDGSGAEPRGAAADEPANSDPHCVFAESADEWLIERVKGSDDPALVAVVTADRRVAGRAKGRGAKVVSPRDFRERCSS